jgi:hypothetical protein
METPTVKYPLAFDMDGNPITMPPEAAAWRVRRGGGRRGRPRPVFDQESGRQLEIPLTATIEDLIDEGCKPDRYRLEAVDAEGRLIPDVVAIIELPGARNGEPDEEPQTATPSAPAQMDGNQQLIAQLVATICGVTTAMITHGMRPVPAPEMPVVIEQPKPEADPNASMWMQLLDPQKLAPLIAMIGSTFGQALKSAGMPIGAP